MANSKLAAGDPITASKLNEITIGTTEPTSPTAGWIWIDTSVTPGIIKVYTGSAWEGLSANAAFSAFLGQDFGG